MLSIKLLLLLSFQISVVFDFPSNIVINLPLLDERQLNWSQNQIQTLEYLLGTLTEVGNVSLVGWQQIWNYDGTLKEIRTIEVTILTDVQPVTVLQAEIIDFHEELPVLKDEIDTVFSSTGILLSGSVKQLPRSGGSSFWEIEKYSLKGHESQYHLQYWEKNITITCLAPVKQLIKTLRQQSVHDVSVLRWNADGTLNLKSSFIFPELLTTVTLASDASLLVLEEAIMAVTKGYLMHSKDMTKYVAEYMKETVPGYIWIVGKDWTYAFFNGYDLEIVVEYNEVKLGEYVIEIRIIGIKIPEL